MEPPVEPGLPVPRATCRLLFVFLPVARSLAGGLPASSALMLLMAFQIRLLHSGVQGPPDSQGSYGLDRVAKWVSQQKTEFKTRHRVRPPEVFGKPLLAGSVI